MESPRHLANELFHLIAKEAGPEVIKRALPASKFIYKVFMPFVYESPPPSAIKTLALSDKEHEPLRESHPAAFVKRLFILGKGLSSAQLKAVLDNSLSVTCSNYTLPIILGPCAGECLDALKELTLSLSYPTMSTTTSISLVTSLYTPGLEKVTLAISRAFSPPRFTTLSFLLDMLWKSAGQNLTHLEFHIPSVQGHVDLYSTLPTLLNNKTFVFPRLRKLVYIAEGYHLSLISFLQRHPHITELGYLADKNHMQSFAWEGPVLLPNVSRLHTYFHDALWLITSCAPHQLISLHINRCKYTFDPAPVLCQIQKQLAHVETLRHLCLDDTARGTGFESKTIAAFVQACPRLI
ncbi:hypothetical protein BDP27DRAFT_1424241 [Rhodocollybia butyracea]|uniref:Uncharacterized protein n=1 Tax=Rhodocollybia butyracea TaxID=206335 RepID=A0A9P5PMP7_9AGAR|nr:hypothetical protein BDP27DRAFT_1424241 [Rhodocollybia butyracea]